MFNFDSSRDKNFFETENISHSQMDCDRHRYECVEKLEPEVEQQNNVPMLFRGQHISKNTSWKNTLF